MDSEQSLNGSKTKIIIFINRFQLINKIFNFRVSSEKININPTSSVKYLGVHLTPILTWNTNLLELIAKLNRVSWSAI